MVMYHVFVLAFLFAPMFILASHFTLRPLVEKRLESSGSTDDAFLAQLPPPLVADLDVDSTDPTDFQDSVVVDPNLPPVISAFESMIQPKDAITTSSENNPNCVSEDPIANDVIISTNQKRELLAKLPPTACPNRPTGFSRSKPKPNSNPGWAPETPQEKEPSTDSPKSNTVDLNPCSDPKIPSIYGIHVTCGGPIGGDAPQLPDVVANCMQEPTSFIEPRGYMPGARITAQFCCQKFENVPPFFEARNCYKTSESSSLYNVDVLPRQAYNNWRRELLKKINRLEQKGLNQ